MGFWAGSAVPPPVNGSRFTAASRLNRFPAPVLEIYSDGQKPSHRH